MRKASLINRIRGLVVLALLMSVFGYTSFSVNAADEVSFSLIEYVTNHQIDTHEEFNEVLEIYCGQAPAPVPDNEISFQVYVDYENNMVSRQLWKIFLRQEAQRPDGQIRRIILTQV